MQTIDPKGHCPPPEKEQRASGGSYAPSGGLGLGLGHQGSHMHPREALEMVMQQESEGPANRVMVMRSYAGLIIRH